MFNNTKYTRIYMSIISNAKSKNRVKRKGTYFENHHIIPKSLGGTNTHDNLVLLTAKEHFVVHHLLTKMLDDKQLQIKMIHAFWRMCHAPQQQQKITSNVYHSIRQERCENLALMLTGNKNHFYGKTHSAETKEKMKIKAIGRNPHNNYLGKSFPAWNKGLNKSQNDGVRRIAQAKGGSNNPMFGRSGHLHPNSQSFVLYDSDKNQVGCIFNSRLEFNNYCRDKSLPFKGLYNTAFDNTVYNDSSKNRRFEKFNGWSLRLFKP